MFLLDSSDSFNKAEDAEKISWFNRAKTFVTDFLTEGKDITIISYDVRFPTRCVHKSSPTLTFEKTVILTKQWRVYTVVSKRLYFNATKRFI